MKKRFLAIALVIATVMTLAIPTFAANATPKTATVLQVEAGAISKDNIAAAEIWAEIPEIAIDTLHTNGGRFNDAWVAGTDDAAPGYMKLAWCAEEGMLYVLYVVNNKGRGLGASKEIEKDTIWWWADFGEGPSGNKTYITETQNADYTTGAKKSCYITLPESFREAGKTFGFDVQQNECMQNAAGRACAYTWSATAPATADDTPIAAAEMGKLTLSANFAGEEPAGGEETEGGNTNTPTTPVASNKRDGAKTAVAYMTTAATKEAVTDAEWAAAPSITIGNLHKFDEANWGTAWVAGENYAKPGTAKFVWNGTKIFIKFEVNNPARGMTGNDAIHKDTLNYWFNFANSTTKPTDAAMFKGDNTYINNQNTDPKDVVILREVELPASLVAGQYIGFEVQQNDNPGSANGKRRCAYTWSSSSAADVNVEISPAEFGQIYLSASKVTDTNRDDGSVSEGGNTGNNPGTSDFTIVALATVGVLATAAIVVSKRRR